MGLASTLALRQGEAPWRTNNPAVVSQVPMHDREANIEEDAISGLVQQETPKHLQAVGVDIKFMKVVEAGISRNFQLLGGCEKRVYMGH